MKLEEAWLKIIEMENCNRFKPNQILSILADLGVFRTNPRIRLVVKDALSYNLWDLILKSRVEPSDIMYITSKLKYDGFSQQVINKLIDSFYKDSSPRGRRLDNSTHNSSCQSITTVSKKEVGLTQNERSQYGLFFNGIALGSNLTEFSSKMMLMYKFIKVIDHVTDASIEQYSGSFANWKDCIISLYFDKDTQRVYKITILAKRPTQSSLNECKNLYRIKYGMPKSIVETIGNCIRERDIFQISTEEFIEIRKFEYSHQILYYNTTLQQIAQAKIEKIKETQHNIQLKKRLNQI